MILLRVLALVAVLVGVVVVAGYVVDAQWVLAVILACAFAGLPFVLFRTSRRRPGP